MAGKQKLFAKEIWKQIEQGEFANGAYLPSERELARKYQLGRITVRLGLKLLLEKHLIETDSTRGYKVIRIPGMPDPSTLNIGGLWCSGLYSEHTYKLYHAANMEARKHGYTLFLHQAADDPADWAAKLGELLEENIAGLLLIPTYSSRTRFMTLANHRMIAALRLSGIPLVMLDRDFPENDIPCVVNDEYNGGRMAAEHFAALGHKKVVLLAGDFNYFISERRFGGFLNRCDELKIELLTIKIHAGDFEKHFPDIKKKIRNFGASAVMINYPGCAEAFMRQLDSLDLDFLLYDTVMDDPVRGNVWCMERPIEAISEKGMLMLLDEIHRGARGLVSQIRLKPILKEIPKINSKITKEDSL